VPYRRGLLRSSSQELSHRKGRYMRDAETTLKTTPITPSTLGFNVFTAPGKAMVGERPRDPSAERSASIQ
jgi:hypothetical protein